MGIQARKTCSICGRRKALRHFVSYRRGGRLRWRGYCLCCHRARGQRYYAAQRCEIGERRRAQRLAGRSDPVRQALIAARRSDLGGDLTLAFARLHLARSCVYCGRVSQPMLFDRIDVAKGYLQSNVVPCCTRCNQLRNGMPIAAWVELVKAVRIADARGLFGSWMEDTRKGS